MESEQLIVNDEDDLEDGEVSIAFLHALYGPRSVVADFFNVGQSTSFLFACVPNSFPTAQMKSMCHLKDQKTF